MKKRGGGFACSFQGVNYHFGHEDVSQVRLSVQTDNSLLVQTAASDIGQGLEAMLIETASLTFNGFPQEKIHWEGSNTTAPEAGGTGASRQSTLTGNALFDACRKLKEMVRPLAAEMLDCHPDDVMFRGERIEVEDRYLLLEEVFEEARKMNFHLLVEGHFQAPPTTPLSVDGKGYPINQFGYALHAAEVEVDTVTGETHVLVVDAFHDAGAILNPVGASGQVEGAIVMGIGFALSEEYLLKDGKPINPGFTNYIIPSLADAPEIRSHFMDLPSPIGELGVKGLAEIPVAVIAPAVINAVETASGARVTHLPATPERILTALDNHDDPKQF